MMKALLRAEFERQFDSEPLLFFAPGRINLIGEHTDYQDGFVFPAAIAHGIFIAIQKNETNHSRLFSIDFQESHTFDTHSFSPKIGHWSTYIMGMVSQLKQAGFPISAFDMVIGGNIPVGAGLSSSAALSVASGLALSELFGLAVDKKTLAKNCQKSEQLFAGLQCGIMDPYASIFGAKGHALLLDCQGISHQAIPVELQDHQLLLVNTKVKHSLADTAYNQRRASCEESVDLLQSHFKGIQTLREVPFEGLNHVQSILPLRLFPKAKHVISENHRVLQASRAIENRDLKSFGELLYASHHSLSQDYEVSCQELDFLVSQAKQIEGVLGARMMGGGFGGCTLNLIKSDGLEGFESEIRDAYQQQFGVTPEFIPVELSNGAHPLQ